MTTARNAFCRDAALAEMAAWEKFGPAEVAAGDLAQADLDRNVAAWNALAELFDADGHHSDFDIHALPVATLIARFGRLEAVVAADLAHHEAALARPSATPEQRRERTERRDAVRLIHTRIQRSREHWETLQRLNVQLRASAARKAA